MKKLFILCTLVGLVACVKEPETVDGRSVASAVNPEAPFLWKNKTFPKTLYVSSNFSDSESTSLSNTANAWNDAVDGKVTFFNVSASRVQNKTNNTNPDLLLDTTLGVYKTTTWPSDIPEDALAVTQIFGRRYNAGSADEFVGIEHADIMVNYHWFIFDTEDNADDIDGDYDLETVIIHEMGHFLGLGHISRDEDRDSSVMYPSITSREVKRTPKSRDIASIADRYDINLGATVASGAVRTPKHVVKEGDEGHETRIMMELRASGECVHKVDGKIVGRHKVDLTKKK